MKICGGDRGSPTHDFVVASWSAGWSKTRENARMLPILIQAMLWGANTDFILWQHLSDFGWGLKERYCSRIFAVQPWQEQRVVK
jgi:hypothetical protein